MTLAESGCIWRTLTDSWLLLMTLADSVCPPESVRVSQSQPESGRVSKSQTLSAVQGWLWPTMADSGGKPESARVSQSHQKSSRVGQSQPESIRFCQNQQEFYIGFGPLLTFCGPWEASKEFVFGKTGAKLYLWPPNCQMKHIFIIMVTFQNRSQKWLKLKYVNCQKR